jgi:hypothetical protein
MMNLDRVLAVAALLAFAGFLGILIGFVPKPGLVVVSVICVGLCAYDFLRIAFLRRSDVARASGVGNIALGLLWLAGGVALSLVAYYGDAANGFYVVATGVIAFGLVQTLVGVFQFVAYHIRRRAEAAQN